MLAAAIIAAACEAVRPGTFASRSAVGAAPRARVALSSTATRAGLVLAPSSASSFEDKILGGMCVRRFLSDDGEKWYMWYSARGADFDPEVVSLSTGRIGLATSSDGVSWNREGAVLTENKDEWFFFDTTHVGIGDVQVMSSQSEKTGGVGMYWCYYFGGDATRKRDDGPKGESMSIGLAMSSDGIHWGRVEGEHPNGAILIPDENEAQFDSAFVGWPQVVIHAELDYILYYHTIDVKSGKYVVAAARGKDAVQFSKVGPVLEAGPPGSFDARGAGARHIIEPRIEGSPRYLMFYEAIDDEGTHSIGLATSKDGLQWDKVGDGPAFAPSTEFGAWDGGAVGRPNVVKVCCF
ncbi:hypothetical protein T492DRAFT_271469 [Pavlovales sp. CCMP2436]|nr:hypothetical protein T492DRAFT_271469 [Pavlovales sp. CCMP2436]